MRFSMKNIRWAKAQGLGRGETGITHKTFCELKPAKTSHTLAQYRYTYEASGAIYRYDALESAPNFLFYFILFTFVFPGFLLLGETRIFI